MVDSEKQRNYCRNTEQVKDGTRNIADEIRKRDLLI